MPGTDTELTLRLLVADLPNTKLCEKSEKLSKPCQMGTHPRVLNESSLMSTNMTGFPCFLRISAFLCLG